jgi:putative ABC transport system ATP-binding protein
VGFVFQFFNLIGTIDATDNVALAHVARGASWKEARARARDGLTDLGLADRADHRPAELSGGEQQRVAIARAVAASPALLLADEPTGDVDAATTVAIMELLSALNQDRGMTVVAVTHDPSLTAFASRTLVMRDGHFDA